MWTITTTGSLGSRSTTIDQTINPLISESINQFIMCFVTPDPPRLPILFRVIISKQKPPLRSDESVVSASAAISRNSTCPTDIFMSRIESVVSPPAPRTLQQGTGETKTHPPSHTLSRRLLVHSLADLLVRCDFCDLIPLDRHAPRVGGNLQSVLDHVIQSSPGGDRFFRGSTTVVFRSEG